MSFLRRLQTFRTFGRGWSKRVAAVERASLDLVSATFAETINGPVSASTKDKLVSPSTTQKGTIMTDTKTIFQSRTVWANLIGLAALLLSQFGFDASGIDQGKLLDSACQAVAAGGFVASSIFRVFAAKKIA